MEGPDWREPLFQEASCRHGSGALYPLLLQNGFTSLLRSSKSDSAQGSYTDLHPISLLGDQCLPHTIPKATPVSPLRTGFLIRACSFLFCVASLRDTACQKQIEGHSRSVSKWMSCLEFGSLVFVSCWHQSLHWWTQPWFDCTRSN